MKVDFDSGMLQFMPKGSYYEDQKVQTQEVSNMWKSLLKYDRTLFCLTMLLKGTSYSKGSMIYLLLSSPQETKYLAKDQLPIGYEEKIIKYNLYNDTLPRALKNLLMLCGRGGKKKINNAKSRRLILSFIFGRDNNELDNMATNYKNKLRTLVRHALGKQDLFKILNGDEKLFNKWIGTYNPNAFTVLLYLFNKPFPIGKSLTYFPKIEQTLKLKEASIKKNVENFKKCMKGLPYLTIMGYRNKYKVPINKKEIFKQSKFTTRQSIQLQSAAKNSGAKITVDYEKQDIYDLFKALYNKVINNDLNDIEKIQNAIKTNSNKIYKADFGKCAIILDASKSMYGSDTQPLHPFLTSLCLINSIDNISRVIVAGGKKLHINNKELVIPSGETSLWKGLITAISQGEEKIIVISDGYENSIKGMFNHLYSHFKKENKNMEVIHLNPVLSTTSRFGTRRMLVKDVKPLPISSYDFLETEHIFYKMITNKEECKNLLTSKYYELIGG